MNKNILAGLMISLCMVNYSAALKFTNTMPVPLFVTVNFFVGRGPYCWPVSGRTGDVPVQPQATIEIETTNCAIEGISARTNPNLKPPVDGPVPFKYDDPKKYILGRDKAFHTVLINNRWQIKEK